MRRKCLLVNRPVVYYNVDEIRYKTLRAIMYQVWIPGVPRKIHEKNQVMTRKRKEKNTVDVETLLILVVLNIICIYCDCIFF
jgi:hypothetical protein